MFTQVTFQYLGEPSRYGGRQEVSSSYTVDVIWTEDLMALKNNPRMIELGVDVQVGILFEADMPQPDPETTRVVKDDLIYQIVDMGKPTSDLGLDGTYTLLLKQIKDYDE